MYDLESLDDEIPTSRFLAVRDKGDVIVVERRDHDGPRQDRARLEVRLIVSVSSESNFYIGFTENLSDGGVFVATHAPRSIGHGVDLIIVLPGESPIRASGTVRWLRQYSEDNETVPGMGVRFEELAPEDAARIHEFMKSRAPMFFDDEPPIVDLPQVAGG
jgi:uncharacterized protein (TIGR02266 family)